MKRLFWYAVVALLVPAALTAQAQTTGRITGKVVDETGAPLAGAEVAVHAKNQNLERTATTNDSGEFLFGLLPIGDYSVTVTRTGMQPEVLEFSLAIGQTVPLDVVLHAGEAASETITVSGGVSELETTAGGVTLSYDKEVNVLPVHDRTLESVALLSPNISYGSTPGDIAIAGAPAYDTTVLLDGAEVSDPYFGSAPTVYLEDAIEEVQVLTNGVSARYGRFQGGVINAVTKSGTNTFEGSLRAELSNESRDATTPFSEEQVDKLNRAYQGTLGGPIVRDRAWFFAGVRNAPVDSANITTESTGETVTQSTEQERYQLKLRGALSENHLVEASYLHYEQTTENDDGLPAGDDLAVGVRSDPRDVYALSYQGVFTANTFLEVTATMKDVDIILGGDVSKGDPFLDVSGSLVGYHNSWWDADDPSGRDNQTAAAILTNFHDAGRFGAHTLEGGVQWVRSETTGDNRQSSTGYNLLAFNPDFFAGAVDGDPRFNLLFANALRWQAVPLGGNQKLDNTAFFLQDGASFERWRFDLGLRYESYKGSGPLSQFNLDFDDLAPRLGVTYSLTPSWQLQATYGRYVSRLNDNVAANATGVGGAPFIETFYLGPDLLFATGDEIQAAIRNDDYWPIVTSYTHPDAGANVLADDMDAPHVDETTLSVRSALPNNAGSFVVTYTDRKYRKLLDNFVGGVCDYDLSFGRPCPEGNTTVATVNGQTVEVDTTVWANEPRARRNYQALTAAVRWRASRALDVGGNYTFAKTRVNYEGEAQNQPASGSAFGNVERAKDMAAAAPWGWADDDIRNRVNLWGIYHWDWQAAGALTLGSILRYESGLPYSLVGQVALRDIPEYVSSDSGTYPHYFSERGQFRFDSWWALDLSVRYDIPIFRSLRPQIELSARNVLNNDAVTGFQTSVRPIYSDPSNPSPDNVIGFVPTGNCGLDDEPSESCTGFGRIRNQDDYQPPRRYLFTVGISF